MSGNSDCGDGGSGGCIGGHVWWWRCHGFLLLEEDRVIWIEVETYCSIAWKIEKLEYEINLPRLELHLSNP